MKLEADCWYIKWFTTQKMHQCDSVKPQIWRFIVKCTSWGFANNFYNNVDIQIKFTLSCSWYTRLQDWNWKTTQYVYTLCMWMLKCVHFCSDLVHIQPPNVTSTLFFFCFLKNINWKSFLNQSALHFLWHTWSVWP